MTQKIFRNSLFISVFILVLCVVIFCFVLYGHIMDSLFSELRIEVAYVEAGIEAGEGEYFENLSTDRRITVIDRDGWVVYDSRGDSAVMENHLDRREISEAIESGSGRSVHYSGTTMENTLYYAKLMPDGRILRLSAPHETVFGVMAQVLYPMLAALLIILLLCALISSRLSRQITEPINAIDLENPAEGSLYTELEPLVHRVREQNRTIRNQMSELVRKQREFAAICENMSEGLILLDNRGGIVFVNNFALEALGSKTGIKSLSRSNCRAEICEGMEAALSGEKLETVFEHGERLLQLISNPVVSAGQVTGAALLILDVTEREKRDELRREFSANVSHELKTPLTSISGFAELMKEGIVSPDKMLEFSADIYAESRRLISLVEDIMRLSRLEVGEMEPENEEVGLLSLAGSVADNLSAFAEKNAVEIDVYGEESTVWGNRQILSEMVYNLCENAIKYNKPEGKVSIGVCCVGSETRLSVRDTGIGIARNHQSRIFERFYRVDKSHSKSIGGTGLGLSIVRHGAKYHDARIELVSEEGMGSEFIIIFPDRGDRQ